MTGPESVQRSPEWLQWRKGRLMASEISAIMGESPWGCAEDIFMEKLGLGKERVVTDRMQAGIDNEPIALAMLNERIRGAHFHPLVVEHDTLPLGASLDGYYKQEISIDKCGIDCDQSYSWIAEIKCPSSQKGLIEAKDGIVPEIYKLQIQAQLLCSDSEMCFYCVYYEGEIAIVEVYPDLEMQKRIISETKAFWEHVQNLEPPEPKYVERDDEEWLKAVATLTELQRDIKTLQDRESEAKARLIELSNGKSTKGYGMGVIHSVRAGSVDYSALCAENNIDSAKYRKPATQVVTVRKVK